MAYEESESDDEFLELSSNPFIVFILVSMCILGVSEFDTIQEKLTTVFL